MPISLKWGHQAWTAPLTSQTSISPFPGTALSTANVAAGDRLYVWVVHKNYTVTNSAPAGWTKLVEYADGTVSPGNGTGSVTVTCYYYDWQATDDPATFAAPISWSGDPNIATFAWDVWSKDAGENWLPPAYVTGQRTASAASAQHGTGGVGIDIPDGAVVMAVVGISDDSSTFNRGNTALSNYMSGGSPVWAGDYVESPATHFNTTTSNDMSADKGHRFVTTGAADVDLNVTTTLSAAETGAIVWVVQGVESAAPAGPQGTGTGTYSFAGAATGETPPNPTDVVLFDAEGTEATANATTVSNTHNATEGATVLAFAVTRGADPVTGITYDGVAMTPRGSIGHDNDPANGSIYLFRMFGAPAGPKTVEATQAAADRITLFTLSYINAGTVARTFTSGVSNSASSDPVTVGAGEMAVQAFGSQNSPFTGSIGGGTLRANIAGYTNDANLIVLDSSSSVTFTVDMGRGSWSGIRLHLTVAAEPGDGIASGGYSFAGAATGKQIPKGTASGGYAFAGAAAGSAQKRGVAAGAYAFTGAATGTAPLIEPAEGVSAGAYIWAGAAVGTRTPKGTASGGYGWAGAATGAAPVVEPAEGVSAGAYTWTGAAVGSTQKRGTAAGTHTWDGAAVGHAEHRGDVAGGYGWAGDAVGETEHLGISAGSYDWAGTAVGEAEHLGISAGAYAWDGAAAGEAEHRGTGSGGYGWAGTAQGFAPVVGVNDGSGAGTYGWAGDATGVTEHRGTAAGAHTWTGAATGRTAHRGASTGSYGWTGEAVGEAEYRGASAGSYGWDGAATGTAPAVEPAEGTGSGAYGWAGVAQGFAPAVGVNDGSGAGTYGWTGEAAGETEHRGASTGGYGWAGAATGTAPAVAANEGTSTGTYRWSGTAVGATSKRGSGAGTHRWAGVATGRTQKLGISAGSYDWAGTAVGETPPVSPSEGQASGSYGWIGTGHGARDSRGAVSGRYGWLGTPVGYAAVKIQSRPEWERPGGGRVEAAGGRPIEAVGGRPVEPAGGHAIVI